jgi:hypothetical protein
MIIIAIVMNRCSIQTQLLINDDFLPFHLSTEFFD